MTAYQTAIENLQSLGYSALQASFLRLVGLHSGVFLRRQYLQFAGISSGKHATEFMNKLIARGHCRTFRLAGKVAVYHLQSKVTYRAIGHPDLCFRRPHGLDYVKTKLLSLDFVLRNPQNTYLPTEREKMDYFVHYLRVPAVDLPCKIYRSPRAKSATERYFVDKFPVFLSPTSVVHFTFVSAGSWPRLDEFRSHLRLYGRLFRALGKVRLVYIHHDSFRVSEAEACFHTMLNSGGERQLESPGLARYFELRHAWEQEEYEKVGSIELLFLSQSRKKYAAPRYDLLYSEWKCREENAARKECYGEEDEFIVGEFQPYRINVDWRTFMIHQQRQSSRSTGDKPAASCFPPLGHSECHLSFTATDGRTPT